MASIWLNCREHVFRIGIVPEELLFCVSIFLRANEPKGEGTQGAEVTSKVNISVLLPVSFRERYKENLSREYDPGDPNFNFDVPPSFSSQNPQPAQARRFFKQVPTCDNSNKKLAMVICQAQEDLRAADNDYEAQEPAYEWVCFKAHQVYLSVFIKHVNCFCLQAAEKALKAAQFSVDAITSFNHDLVAIVATIEDVELRKLAMKLQVRGSNLLQ